MYNGNVDEEMKNSKLKLSSFNLHVDNQVTFNTMIYFLHVSF